MKKLIALFLVALMLVTAAGCASAVSVVSAQIDGDGHLILSMSDGKTLDAGLARGGQGDEGPQGEKGDTGAQGVQGEQGISGLDGVGIKKAAVNDNGHLMLRLTDGTLIDAGYVMGADGADGTNGRDGTDGADGSNGTNGADGLTPYIGENGNWWIGEEDTGVIAKGNDFIYDNRGEGTVLLAYVGNDFDVVIPEKTTEIAEGAFRENKSICSVTIPKNVLSIRDYAFYDCPQLESVNLNEVLYIGDLAFTGCNNLSHIEWNPPIGNSANSEPAVIGNSAFSECWNLKSFPFSDKGFYNIGGSAFESSGLNGTLSFMTSAIGYNAFQGTHISSLDLTLAGLIYPGAFAFCSQLESVSLTLADIWTGEYGRDNNGYYIHMYLDETFKNCQKLKAMSLPQNTSANILVWGNDDPKIVNAAARWTIGDSAFANTALESISLPQTTTWIGENAFDNCSQLSNITLPEGLQSIEANAFTATALTNVTIPSTVIMIGDGAFCNCVSLTAVTVNATTPPSTSIYVNNGMAAYAGFFNGCTGLTDVFVPSASLTQYKNTGTVPLGYTGYIYISIWKIYADIIKPIS